MTPEQYEVKKLREALRKRTAKGRLEILRWQRDHPDKVAIYKRRWLLRNPEKRKCHIVVGNAIRDGKLFKQPCEVCGSNSVTAHHDDYSKPMVVRWLCTKHHGEHHRKYP